MTIDDIKKLVEVVRDTGIAELEVHWGTDSVRVQAAAFKGQEFIVPSVLPVPISAGIAPVLSAASAASAPSEVAESVAPKKEEDPGIVVKSPIVGTYYDAASPGVPPFVKVGDQVEPKQVLCIIESMKLMNEIEAEIAGTILLKHVENGRPVEYGEPLFTLRPM